MMRSLLHIRLLPLVFSVLASGCASLQIDVDVYKGPLAHEQEIQVRQYAAMAISAKPLLESMYCRASVNPKPDQPCFYTPEPNCENLGNFRVKFLCEVLDLYRDKPAAASVAALNDKGLLFRSQSRNPTLGLDSLTTAVTQAMAAQPSIDRQQKIDMAVDSLNEALIFFAQKMLYMTNNELLFGGPPADGKQPEPMIPVLQSLGNTILVHANDLRRQNNRFTDLARRANSEGSAVQLAFEPEAAVTLAAIRTRLGRYNFSGPAQSGDEKVDTATAEQKAELARLQTEAKAYLGSIASLLAAHRSVVGELPAPLSDSGATEVDIAAAAADRAAIKNLYPDKAVAGEPDSGTLQPLNDWLSLEQASGVAVSPNRPARLQGLKEFVTTENARLTAAGAVSTGNRRVTWNVLENYIKARIELARIRLGELQTPAIALQVVIDKQNREERARLDKQIKDGRLGSQDVLRQKAMSMVDVVDDAVLTAARQLKTRDPRVVKELLLSELGTLEANIGKNSFTAADVKLARAVITQFDMGSTACQSEQEVQNCRALNTVDVVDALIARLRAQRVQAIATGEHERAADLLKAINAAYDQRTAMIYLRPASDYLRSVYSTNQLQDGTEQQYRNMLTDWFKKYLNPFEDDDKDSGRKELEKIHWQNVNKVTVSGGGFTNYVLAKDDVGNWYVKAYGSDPEAIIKSATSLALFNSGKQINLNLLRRFEVQRQLDDDKSLGAERRTELRKELADSNKAGGSALLKVRERYAGRYRRDTGTQANALLAVAIELGAKLNAEIAQVPDWPETECPLAKSRELIEPLEARHLAAPRDKLAKAVADEADPAKTGAKTLEDVEKSILAMLTGMHLYSSDVQRVLGQVKDAACGSAPRTAGDRLRGYVRAQVAAAATERKASIERYEDALSHILDVAGEK